MEVTENAVMSEEMGNQRTLVALHEQGIRVAIDNFGTGYSSLAHLRDLPVDQLKVDHSFVRNMIDRPADKRIVQAVIDLAHNFERTVVADGVLDEETLDTLTLMGCEFGQGECVGSPAAADALLDEQKTGYW